MSRDIFMQIINDKLYIIFALTILVYLLSWLIMFKLCFHILGLDSGVKRLYPAVLILFLNSFIGKQVIPSSIYGIVMIGAIIALIAILGRVNILLAAWSGILGLLFSVAGDIIIATPLTSIKGITPFFFKTPLGNVVVGLVELFFPAFALVILTKFKNISLIPHFRKKSTRLNLLRVAAFGLSFYWIYCSLLRLLTSLLEYPRQILFNVISEWLAAISSAVLYFYIHTVTKKEQEEERRQFEYERQQHEYTQRLNEEKIARLEQQNDRLNQLYEYIMSNKTEQQEVKEDLRDIKESILSIREQNISEINQTRTLLQEGDPASSNNQMTQREMALLRLIVQGKSNKEIAFELHISIATVKKNITDLLVKLNKQDRVQLAVYALRNGLVRLED
ncbi:MAG TPA: response regulator transcription factor [Bacillota bacterium]|nr:response regulator transcription factor [Bacillota bacterium]